MYLSYFDESGDDGYPNYSSNLFVLTSIYFHHDSWKTNHNKMLNFRKELKILYSFPIKLEFHCKDFLQDKNPYHKKYSPLIRKEILFKLFQFYTNLDIKIINVVIDKLKIKSQNYNVLEMALKYSVQRIENDMVNNNSNSKFLIITDEGRIDKMRQISRKIQKINFIPSRFHKMTYRREISNLIEDPLPKKSEQSYFIQIADSISYIINLYTNQFLKEIPEQMPNRVSRVLAKKDLESLLEVIKPCLNVKASKSNQFGIVHYPK